MTKEQLTKLNNIMGDRLGRIPVGYPDAGDSAWQFKRSGELMFPYRTGVEYKESPTSSLLIATSVYQLDQQLPGEDRWVISRWLEPGWTAPDVSGAYGELADEPTRLSPEEWKDRFPDLGWPTGGWWFAVQPLREGVEPTEEWTRWAVDHLDWQRNMSLRETFRAITDTMNRREAERKSGVVDSLRDCWTNHVPGVRGGSYLAFTEPLKGNQ